MEHSAARRVRRKLRTTRRVGSCGKRTTCYSHLSGRLRVCRTALRQNRFLKTKLINDTRSVLGLNLTDIVVTKTCLLNLNDVSVFACLIFLLIMTDVCGPVVSIFGRVTALVLLSIHVSHVHRVGSVPTRRNSRSYAMRNCSVYFSGISFTCRADGRILHGISFATGRNGMATLIKPSKKNGDASTGLTTHF